MSEKYLVTGATGFVGANIVRALVSQNKDVSILVRDEKLNWRLQDIASKLSVYACDLLSPQLDETIAKIKPNYIFHLAAYGALPEEDSVDLIFDVNLKGTIRLLNAVKKNPFTLFINTGSNSEYGVKYAPMKETDLPEPINEYGVSKVAATLYVKKEAVKNNLPIVTFRLFSAYGYYEEPTRFFPWVITRALKSNAIELTSPTSVRNFTFIEDIVSAYIQAKNVSFTPGDIINIAGEKQYTLEDAVTTIVKLSNSNSVLQWGAYKQQVRQVEKGIWQANITHAKEVLHWQPQYSLEKGLEKTIVWMKNNIQFYEK